MKKSSIFLLVGCAMIFIAIMFFLYALQHPEKSFPWGNSVTYVLYFVYLLSTICMFILSIKNKRH